MTETKVTPAQLLSAHILNIWQRQEPLNYEVTNKIVANIGDCPNEIMKEVLENYDDGTLQDVIYSFRTDGGEATNIQQFDRNFEVEVRAIKIYSQWVGWWHLYGGYNPENWPWIENAVFIDLVEEKEVTRIERTFEYKKD